MNCSNIFTYLTLLIITLFSISCGKNSEKTDVHNYSGYNDDTFQYLHNADKVDSLFFSVLNSYLAKGEYLGLERLYVLSDDTKRELIINGIRNNNWGLFISCYYEDISDSLFITEIKKILDSQNALNLFKYLKNEISSEGSRLLPDGDYRRKTDDLIEIIYDIDNANADLKDSLMLLKQDVQTYIMLDSRKNKISNLSIKQAKLSEEIRLLEEYVEDNDYFYGGANVVGKLSNNLYEVTEQDPYRSGLNRYVLITKETEFTSNGRFSLYLKNGGYRDVQLQSGFTESWPSIIEVTASEREYIDKQKADLKDKKELHSIRLKGYELAESMYYVDLNRLNFNYNTGSVTDVDGNTYNTVKIGDQWWMAENLRATHYRESTPIPNIKEDDIWADLNTGAYCYYSNDRANMDSQGALYNWYAVNDVRNIAPEGWRVATEEDWNELELFLDKNNNPIEEINEKRDKDIARKLKSLRSWNSGNKGFNEFAFSALPSGVRSCGYSSKVAFRGNGRETIFWTDTENDDKNAVGRALRGSREIINEYQLQKQYGASVRCIKGERPNKSPSASLTIAPNTNSVDTLYTFNASKSNDFEDDNSELQFRWDFNSDGIWDKDWSFDTTTSYGFQEAGIYKITLEVQDTEGAIGITSSEIKVYKFGSVTDIDGNVYKTISIGTQVWLAENLKVTHYRNGDPIQKAGSFDVKNRGGSYSYYNNDVTNLDTYGALYNWYAVNDVRNIAPEGWRVATEEDWNELELFLSLSRSAVDRANQKPKKDEGRKLKSLTGWDSGRNGADEVGFCALPAGQRGLTIGEFGNLPKQYYFGHIGSVAMFWTANEENDKSGWCRFLRGDKDNIRGRTHTKLMEFSVRFVKE